ncbi:MAG: alternative ribosome rescue aminoacyl-tRNA hydrolase ArfB [Candidatus Promineifilaceae bacterium]
MVVEINARVRIPLSELTFRFSTSSGPGGQHVNKAATKVTLLFDVVHSPALDEATRAYLLRRLAHRLNKEGVLQVVVQSSRSQYQNRETAVRRFQQILAQALARQRPRLKTRPSRKAIEKRLQAKKKQSQKKKERRQRWK